MRTPADRALVGESGAGHALTDDQFRLTEPLAPAKPEHTPPLRGHAARRREAEATTAAIINVQSVTTTESGGPRGWDAAKRLKGRKRHTAVDTQGLLLGVVVHAADIQDADGLSDLLKRVKPLYHRLRAVFAESIYNRLTQ